MYILIAAGAGALIITLISLRIIMKKRKKNNKPVEGEESDFVTLNVASLQGKNTYKQDIPGEIVLNETREQGFKRQIRDFSSNNPDIVAQLLRTWIKEDEDNE
jgi:flagellar M-ring protein FliF